MKLTIHWNNNTDIDIALNDTPAAHAMYRYYKHLQHLKFDFKSHTYDNPFDQDHYKLDQSLTNVQQAAHRLGLTVDANYKVTQQDLNCWHEIYEKNYNGDPTWLEFHESIHMAEMLLRNDDVTDINFDYREQAGMLVTPFDRTWLKFGTTKVTKGTVFVQWQELGKTPYNYFIDGEPDNCKRLCELAKPWVYFKPNIYISVVDIDHAENRRWEDFNNWFAKYRQCWTQHWEINNWRPEEMFTVIPIGTVDNVSLLVNRFQNNQFPDRITRL